MLQLDAKRSFGDGCGSVCRVQWPRGRSQPGCRAQELFGDWKPLKRIMGSSLLRKTGAALHAVTPCPSARDCSQSPRRQSLCPQGRRAAAPKVRGVSILAVAVFASSWRDAQRGKGSSQGPRRRPFGYRGVSPEAYLRSTPQGDFPRNVWNALARAHTSTYLRRKALRH